jgi:DNA-binding NarL/FixJ family response regulator
MIDPEVRQQVERLLESVRREPDVLPVAEVMALRATGYDIGIDRADDETVVYVTQRPDARLGALTTREREVATLAAVGFTNEQIATALFVSLATVKDHMHSIFSRTGFTSRSQLIAAWYGGFEPWSGLAGDPADSTADPN